MLVINQIVFYYPQKFNVNDIIFLLQKYFVTLIEGLLIKIKELQTAKTFSLF